MSNVRNVISLLCILLFVYAKIAPAWNSFSLISLPCAIHVLCHTFRLSTLLLKFGKYMLPFKKSLIASIIVGLFLTGCGGSSSGNNSQTAMDNSASDAATTEQVKTAEEPVKPVEPSESNDAQVEPSGSATGSVEPAKPAESDNSSAEPAKPETPSNPTVVPVNPNKPVNPSQPSGDSKDDKNSGDSNLNFV